MVLLCISLSACKQNDKGDAQLPMEEEKIIDILIDMHYAGEASRITRGINHDSLLRVYTNQVLEIQKIDSTQLNNLMKYLESNLDTYYKIEQKVHLKIKELKENKKS
jgi:hypothetical protein